MKSWMKTILTSQVHPVLDPLDVCRAVGNKMVRVALRFAKDEMCNEDEKRFKKVDGRAACIAYVGEVQACSHRQQLQLMLKQEVRPLSIKKLKHNHKDEEPGAILFAERACKPR